MKRDSRVLDMLVSSTEPRIDHSYKKTRMKQSTCCESTQKLFLNTVRGTKHQVVESH